MLVVIGVSQFYLIFNIMPCGENMCDIKIYFYTQNIKHPYFTHVWLFVQYKIHLFEHPIWFNKKIFEDFIVINNYL